MHIENTKKTKKWVLYGGVFNPVGNHHVQIARAVVDQFGSLVVVPCGDYGYKPATQRTTQEHRRKIVEYGFGGLNDTEIDFHDFDNGVFTPTYELDMRYRLLYPEQEICHVIGDDLIKGGSQNESQIQQRWYRGLGVWETLTFVIVSNSKVGLDPQDLPPHHLLLKVGELYGRSTVIRKRVAAGFPISDFVSPAVASYIHENGLYKDEPLS